MTIKCFLVFQPPAAITRLSSSMSSLYFPFLNVRLNVLSVSLLAEVAAEPGAVFFLQLCSILVNIWAGVGHGLLTFPTTNTSYVVAPRQSLVC